MKRVRFNALCSVHDKHMHIHTYAHIHSKGVFTDKELAIKAPCEFDKPLKTNLRTKEPYADHIYTEGKPEKHH